MQGFFQIKKIKFSYFFIGSVTGLSLIFFMMYVAGWLVCHFPVGNYGIVPFILLAILLLFPILLLGHIGKKISNQLCVNISNFLAGFYIFGFLLAILLDIALFFAMIAGFWGLLE